MKRSIATLAAILGFALSPATQAGVFTISSPNALNSSSIVLDIANNDGFDLLKVTFDLSTTTSNAPGNPPLTFGGAFGLSGPPSGTATVFGVLNSTEFGFDFTDFNDGESFSFSWDPDIATDVDYGAVVGEMEGMGITLVTSGGTVSGALGLGVIENQTVLIAIIESPAAVPEPGAIALLGIGLAGLGFARRRKLA